MHTYCTYYNLLVNLYLLGDNTAILTDQDITVFFFITLLWIGYAYYWPEYSLDAGQISDSLASQNYSAWTKKKSSLSFSILRFTSHHSLRFHSASCFTFPSPTTIFFPLSFLTFLHSLSLLFFPLSNHYQPLSLSINLHLCLSVWN